MKTAAACLVLGLTLATAAPAPAPAPGIITAQPPGRLAPNLAPAPSPRANMPARKIDWGRPCTLVTTPADSFEILSNCTNCGSGVTATPEPGCTFNSFTVTVGQYFDISYHSSAHHLYMGPQKCMYSPASKAVEVCPYADASVVTPATPCVVPFMQSGIYYISDAAENPGSTNDYCNSFGANMMVTVTAAQAPGQSQAGVVGGGGAGTR